MAKIYYESDADLDALKSKTVADHRVREPGARTGAEFAR